MLIIENKERLLGKTLGKRNFYVDGIKETFDMDGMLHNKMNHKYQISITNRKYAITITLDRNIEYYIHNDTEKYYKLQSSTGEHIYIESKQIKNMDVFIDKLRYVALTKFN